MATKTAEKRYWEGVGRRKTAVARVRIVKGHGAIKMAGKEYKDYFKMEHHQRMVAAPLKEAAGEALWDVNATIKGGGVNAQAEAVRHGLSRALVKNDATLIKRLRTAGYLTRDSRMVERKKYGLKKARRSPQWKKR